MRDLTPRPASASSVTLIRQMELTDANLLGNVHGGELMKLVDTAGGLAAIKHCAGPVVTVALDEMTFLEPVFVGDIVTVKAMVNDSGRTSLEVGVRVEAETLSTGRRVHTSSAYLVYVALDQRGRPRPRTRSSACARPRRSFAGNTAWPGSRPSSRRGRTPATRARTPEPAGSRQPVPSGSLMPSRRSSSAASPSNRPSSRSSQGVALTFRSWK
jgi:acyl-CoA hydrolase